NLSVEIDEGQPTGRHLDVETDDRGRFALPGLVPARYRLTIHRDGWKQSVEDYGERTIPAGVCVDVKLVLEPDLQAVLKGRVTCPAGKLPEGTKVFVMRIGRGGGSASLEKDG